MELNRTCSLYSEIGGGPTGSRSMPDSGWYDSHGIRASWYDSCCIHLGMIHAAFKIGMFHIAFRLV